MAKMTPEEQYREAFYGRVQKECRKHKINCSMVYDRIHIYTKYEDFYFTPDPNEITLMHRNAQKESDGGYKYHVQGVWSNRTPESLVREVVRHTKYRYTEDGEYRAEKDMQAEKDAKQNVKIAGHEETKPKDKTNTPHWKANRQKQIQEFRDELRELCEEHGLNCRDVNQITYIDNGFEEFLIEFATSHTKIQSRRCVTLRIKEACDHIYEPDGLLPIDVVEFAESNFTISNQKEYADAFYSAIKERCNQCGFKYERKGDRVYIHGTNATYYVDAVCGKPMEIYQHGVKSALITCPDDAHILYVMHFIEEHDKTAEAKRNQKDCGRIALIAAAISGWVFAGVLLAYILCSR